MKRRNEVLVGIMLTIATIIVVIGTIWLVRGGLSRGYPLYTRFKWGENVKAGQPVRLAGVQVGYVGDVELDPGGTIIVTMKVEKQYQVPDNSTAAVQPVGVFGDQEIALIPKTVGHRSYFDVGDTVPAATPKPGLDMLMARADTVSARLDDVARSIQVEMVQHGGIADLRRTMENLNSLVSQFATIAAEQSRELTATQEQFRRTMAAVDPKVVDSTMKNLRATSANFAAVTDSLRKTSAHINQILAKVDSGGGSAAMLINNPGLYNDLRHTIASMDSLITDVKKNPKRYINVKVF